WNCNANFVELPQKLEALAGHLADVGRDRDEITVTCLASIVVGETHAAAAEKLAAMLRARGVDDPEAIVGDPAVRHQVLPRLLFGDPEEVVAQVHALVAVGLDGVVVNMPIDGHDPLAVRLAGETLTKALG